MIGRPSDSMWGNMESTLHARRRNSEFLREIIFRGAPFEFGPQGIREAFRASFGDLEWKFGPFKTIPEFQKIQNLENGIFCCLSKFYL